MKYIKFFIVLAMVLLMTTAVCAAENDVYFVRDGGSGDGSNASQAGASLADAYTALSDGGTIVVCGPYTINSVFNSIAHSGKITITSVYNGVDYRKSNAALIFASSMFLGGETEFSNIVISSAASYPVIYAFNKPTVIGNGVECNKVNGSEQYVSLVGGHNKTQTLKTTTLTINSGTWQRVRGGAGEGGSIKYTVNLEINGGTFIERVSLASISNFSGTIDAIINGGTFRQGMVAATLADGERFDGIVNLEINGGTFYGQLGVASTTLGDYFGEFNVTFGGGEFAHLVEFTGPATLSGSMTASFKGDIDFGAKETGTYTFNNPIRNDGADPWLFYHNGYYYYTSTTSTSSVKLTRVANIGDLMFSSGTTIYTPEEGKAWSNSTWSPTILHYTDEEVGEGNGGWYLYFGGEDETDTSDVGHRMYVLKCLDGDNLLGRWGNPVTGEVNVPQRVSAPDIAGFDDVWAAGQGDVRINGKVYTIYVTEKGRYTSDFHQTINILPMTNPWTFEGQSTVICVPEYDWEMVGYGILSNGLWAPKVVEAVTPVYGDDGSVFLVYSGSNYTRDEYCLGQLKYNGGDPLLASSWVKKSNPILSQGNGVRGTGSASYVTDTSGQSWVCYNAYLDSSETRNRYAMVEPYTATSAGVVIGDGSGIAAPETKTYTAAVNPMSLAQKTSGFKIFHLYSEKTDKGARLSFNAYEGATSYIIYRDGTYLGTSSTFEYVDENMPAGMHTYRVDVMQKRPGTAYNMRIASATARIANYDGIVYGDMDENGTISVKDSLILLKSILNNEIEASLLDVMKQMKYIF